MGSMEEVHMPQNGINHPGVTALATAMQHNAGLRILNLNDNTFTEKGAIAMAQVQRPLRWLLANENVYLLWLVLLHTGKQAVDWVQQQNNDLLKVWCVWGCSR